MFAHPTVASVRAESKAVTSHRTPKLCAATLAAVVVASIVAPLQIRGGENGAIPIERKIDRSPVDLVLDPQEKWLVTANQTADSVSLVRIADGKVLDELRVGRRPTAVALCPDGRTLLLSGADSGAVTVFEVDGERLKLLATISVGFEPHGIAVSSHGKTAWVALAAGDRVAVLDLAARKVVAEVPVGRWPRYVALSPDGTRLAVGASGDRGICVIDTQTRKLLYTETFGGLNIGHLHASADGEHVYFPWMIYGANPISASNIRRGWVLASRFARVRLDGKARRDAISLDPQGQAVADPHGLDLTSDESHAVLSASGTHELLVYRLRDLPWMAYGGPGDHIDPDLLADKDRFYRIPLGGRPMGLQVAGDDRTVYVANYLDNSVQVVDLSERQIVREIGLGGPAEPSLERKGAAIFYDGRRSLDQWYSCHTCHYEGGGNAEPMDTLNDGTTFSVKTVLPLYNVDATAPWTWHGWQQDFDAALQKSLTSTMLGSEPNSDDLAALGAFLKSLTPPPNPYLQADGSLTPAAQRGQRVFESEQAGCATCHSGRYSTDGQVHDVGLGKRGDRYQGFNTPSLLGVYRKTRLLHDGRSRSLEELLTGPHNPADVVGDGELSDEERRDLIAYLKSL